MLASVHCRAEWFYTGFFNVELDSHNHMPNPANWCWQAMAPIYVQALSTNFADFLYRGSLVAATDNTSFADTGVSSTPLLWAGSPNVLCIVRALDGGDGVFLVALATQRNSNAKGNLLMPTTSAWVPLPGFPKPIVLRAMLQGAVYIVKANTTKPGAPPITYQLDSWHLPTHPLFWATESAVLEAEMFQGHLHVTATARDPMPIVTETPRHADALDLTEFTTFVDLPLLPRGHARYMHTEHHGRCKSVRVLARRGTVAVDVWDDAGAGVATALVPQTRASHDATHHRWEWIVFVFAHNPVEHDTRGEPCHKLTISGSAQVDKLEIIF